MAILDLPYATITWLFSSDIDNNDYDFKCISHGEKLLAFFGVLYCYFLLIFLCIRFGERLSFS
jgi:hypothetical protein